MHIINRYLPKSLRHLILALGTIALCITIAQPVSAFCGFFVGRSETKLNNSTSRVVIFRDGNRSVFTMANNFQGDVKDFARIVPIPVIPKREQVKIGDSQIVDHLDAFTAPRLVRYVDDFNQMLLNDVSTVIVWGGLLIFGLLLFAVIGKMSWQEKLVILLILLVLCVLATPSFLNQANKAKSSDRLLASESVKVVDQFTVGEYDVALLDATESDGLVNWLKTNDYKLPQGAEVMLNDYIRQGMKFFVVKINLETLQTREAGFLRPIVIEYESPKFTLPIRLGTLNSTSDQDLTVYVLSYGSFAEVANYPTVPIPSDSSSMAKTPSGEELPGFIKHNFSEFYQAVFQKAYENAGKSAAFLEFAGFFGRCDPCAISFEEIAKLDENLPRLGASSATKSVTMTRLHLRYNQKTFPRDLEFRLVSPEEMQSQLHGQNPKPMQRLSFRQTGTLLQGRYVIRDVQGGAWSFSRLKYHWQMRNTNANLTKLTGWSPEKIQQQAQSASSSAIAE